MPEEALPIPHNPALRNLHTVRREYRDLLQRPLRGFLQLKGEEAVVEGRTYVSAASVKVEVVEGVLAIPLPPGDYTLRGTLWSAEEEQAEITESFSIDEDGEEE